jgi:hypothetical protein
MHPSILASIDRMIAPKILSAPPPTELHNCSIFSVVYSIGTTHDDGLINETFAHGSLKRAIIFFY